MERVAFNFTADSVGKRVVRRDGIVTLIVSFDPNYRCGRCVGLSDNWLFRNGQYKDNGEKTDYDIVKVLD